MHTYPRIKSVKVLEDKKLEVTFDNSIRKIYDCFSILQEEPFNVLQDNIFFKNVHVEPNGYGISWNDDIDLSESELWINGKNI